MKTLSGLIGKPVISIYEAKIEGYIKRVLFDKKLSTLCLLEIFDDDTQAEKLIERKNIYNIGNDAVTIKNSDAVLLDVADADFFANPMNFDVYKTDGNLVGKISDLEIDDKFKTTKISLQNNNQININQILVSGKDVVFLKDNAKAALQNFKSKPKLQTLSVDNLKVEIQARPQMPKKLVSNNADFLIGRVINKNIYADNGELLAKRNTKISNVIIDIIGKNGKLKELTSFSA